MAELIGNETRLLDMNVTKAASQSVGPGPPTREQRIEAYMLLYICYPVLLTCCTIGNFLNLIILVRDKGKSSTRCYMIAVAVSDLFVLWMFFPEFLWNVSATLQLPYYNLENKARIWNFRGVQIWGLESAIHICDWVLIAFSLERLLLVVRPFRFRCLQHASVARTAILVITACATIFCTHNLVNNYWMLSDLAQTNYTLSKALPKRPLWLKRWETVQNTVEIPVQILKFMTILGINLFLITVIGQQQKTEIGKMRKSQDQAAKKKLRNTNILLLSSVALFLTTQLPSLIFNCIMLAATYGDYSIPPLAILYTVPVTQVIFNANYSVNFFLYLTVSEKYRKEFVRVFCPISIQRKILEDTSRRKRSTFSLGQQSTRNSQARSFLSSFDTYAVDSSPRPPPANSPETKRSIFSYKE